MSSTLIHFSNLFETECLSNILQHIGIIFSSSCILSTEHDNISCG